MHGVTTRGAERRGSARALLGLDALMLYAAMLKAL